MSQNGNFPPLLHKVFSRLWPRRYLILFAYCSIVWLVIFILLFSPPTYEATAIISIKPGPLFVADADKTATAPSEQFARPQITLLESETVIRRAIAAVGSERLYPPKVGAIREANIARSILGEPFRKLSSADSAYANAKRHLTIRQEPQTNIILVTFRNPNSAVAVNFTNALVHSFIHRYFEVYGNTGAVDFFWDQKKKSEKALATASAALADYASSNRLFDIREQRRLLLQQRNDAAAALRTTRGSIAEKESQVTAIPGQLSQMKQPIARSPALQALTEAKDGNSLRVPETASPSLSAVANDVPLLLVRVYQDTVASLVRIHTEIAGLEALEDTQKKALSGIEDQLTAMGAREAEFDRLQLEVTQSKANAELFSRKAFEEQLAQDLNERKFSPVQILQDATPPLRPVWPRPDMLLVLGFLLCVIPWLTATGLHYAIVDDNDADGDRPVSGRS